MYRNKLSSTLGVYERRAYRADAASNVAVVQTSWHDPAEAGHR
jgi:hypothetical protein